jgi:hypothetical protein
MVVPSVRPAISVHRWRIRLVGMKQELAAFTEVVRVFLHWVCLLMVGSNILLDVET